MLGALTTTVTPLAAAMPAKVLVFTVPALLGIENADADGMLGTVTLDLVVVEGCGQNLSWARNYFRRVCRSRCKRRAAKRQARMSE